MSEGYNDVEKMTKEKYFAPLSDASLAMQTCAQLTRDNDNPVVLISSKLHIICCEA